MILSFPHFGICVRDLHASARFYVEGLKRPGFSGGSYL
jgi:hypothetical protein